ncbi:lipid kinase [Limnothrix sp. FACHB-881]|uniref:lipid kinase n=1 Tax=Limnothrix sp. FACHB-881 TaxID=2692819 RepID=UPI0016837EEE|nr:lipid kinase [Limnothrix sp. FACHB-881]MBD2636112.1 lipid kinase [Limnothrix sp. FACHB-881]
MDSVAPQRALLLVNSKSRRGRQLLGRAIAILDEMGFELIFRSTKRSSDFRDLIRQYASRIDCVIIGGGDGTLNAALPALIETRLPLGILPLGTANDLARTLAIPADLKQACAVVAQGVTKAIDVGQVNDRYFFNVASLGLSVSITRQLSGEIKKRWGVFAYAIAAIQALWKSRPFTAKIEVNGELLTVKTVQIAVGNGRYYGGGLSVAWDASIDDQRLDLYSLEIAHWWQMLPLLPAMHAGRLNDCVNVRTIEATSLKIITSRPKSINTDGELSTTTPAEFRVLPAQLKVFVPAARSSSVQSSSAQSNNPQSNNPQSNNLD